MSVRRLAAPGLLALLLAACGSAPKPAPEPVAEPGRPATKAPTKKPAVTLKRGGGYYKDDGPADELPDGLDDIADAEPRPEPLHRFANRPYVVFGKEYVPNTSVRPHRERGMGSWYGKKFHGQKTSIGEPYDMFAMTAAHPTLAIPSYARVTNLANGRSVVVRVIDRGPFHIGRVIDLSYAAAHKLDYIRNGSSQVEVEAIVPDATGVAYAQVAPAEPRPAAAPQRDEIADIAEKLAGEEKPLQKAATIGLNGSGSAIPAGGVLLQLGAFANADNAETMRLRMLRELDWAESELRVNVSGGIHRLHLGPYANRAEAERAAERIRQSHGFKPTFVTR
ncbi:MAG: septal ring lytic transglycosylase RlpA family protein [Rhodocyclales bacterium]|nr:septal ring lytic transglycosylase RlpA family protein [Rhodocyclales bacterium]